MGNCIIKESAMQWGGDDWGTSFARESYSSDDRTNNRFIETERTRLLGVSSLPKASGTKMIKIRISRKQLPHLLKKADISARDDLARLTYAGSDRFEAHRRSWAPALPSIPE